MSTKLVALVRPALVVFSSAAVGGLVVAGAILLFDRDDEADRGRVVMIQGSDLFDGVGGDLDSGPICSYTDRFCITRTIGGEYIALYAVDTYPPARDQTCPLYWDPEDSFDIGSRVVTGLFRSRCNGDRWDITGERLFGPAPRDMDQFPLTVDGERFTVDTRRLLCGAPAEREMSTTCALAPAVD